PTIRSNTAGGGPSIDSKATVAPLLPPEAMAYEPLAAPPPAQPPSAHAITSSAAAMIARGAIRLARNRGARVSLIGPCDIVKIHQGLGQGIHSWCHTSRSYTRAIP